ncbi:MAG: hypothetical protein ABIM58_04485 [candidate division WOR-3 bacterium]|nr:hypothetical protein [Candidatus Omnitrophota bacterium]MCM8807427.1 hypothetical protein [Candidatus Omnitrophota bacterium]
MVNFVKIISNFLVFTFLIFGLFGESKLGIHLIGNYSDGARKIISSCPQVIKVLDPQTNKEMLEAIRDYKKKYPKGIVIMRVWEGTSQIRYKITEDPFNCAEDFWNRVLKPAINSLSIFDRKLIDFLEGPNEGENTPTWESVESARWFGKFWERLAILISEAGFKPCVGSIAVGNPSGSLEEIYEKLKEFVQALKITKQLKGVWCYHAYSIEYTTDLKIEIWYSLRYRIFYEFLRKYYPEVADLPIILTEGGIDRRGNPRTDGWRARGDIEKFKKWLKWFDEELCKDKEVIGVTLFQIGDQQNWWSFNLEPIADWLSDYLLKRKSRPSTEINFF